MRFFLIALLCFLCVANTYSQTGTRKYGAITVEITKAKKPKRISVKVEITTAFPGGDSSWVKSVENSLNKSIPFKNGAKRGTYVVSVKFLVERDGSITDIICVTDPGYGMCQQVKSAVVKRGSGPRWGPGQVRSYGTSSTTLKN